MKSKKLINLSVLAVTTVFVGCGGNDSSTSSITQSSVSNGKGNKNLSAKKRNFNYKAELAKAPELIQQAMNENPIQYANLNRIKELENKKNTSIPCKITSKSKSINSNQGYNYITFEAGTLAENPMLLELVITWDKSATVYDVAYRILSKDDPVNTETNKLIVIKNITKKQYNLEIENLIEKNFLITMNIREMNNRGHLMNIICNVNGITRVIDDFDVAANGKIFERFFTYFGKVVNH